MPPEKRSKPSSGFFSAQSIADGFTNNVLGMVGLVVEGAKSDEDFDLRMKKEKEIAEKVAAKKRAKDGK